jgi:hypothetical protein
MARFTAERPLKVSEISFSTGEILIASINRGRTAPFFYPFSSMIETCEVVPKVDVGRTTKLKLQEKKLVQHTAPVMGFTVFVWGLELRKLRAFAW